jgi:hypothetical protein
VTVTQCIGTFVAAHTVHCCGWFIVIALFFTVTVVTVITAFLYWRCCRFLSSDCSICEVNIHRNAGASYKLFIWAGRAGGVLAHLRIIYNLIIMI